MRARAFTIGFCFGLLPFIVANIHGYRSLSRWIYSSSCFDCGGAFGFPLEMFGYTGFISSWFVMWGGLTANLVIALCAGLVAGLVCRRLFGGPRFR